MALVALTGAFDSMRLPSAASVGLDDSSGLLHSADGDTVDSDSVVDAKADSIEPRTLELINDGVYP